MRRTTASIERAALLVFSFFILIATQFVSPASAQQRDNQEKAFRQKINANTVSVLGGSISSAALRMADDLSRAVGDDDNLRILPIRADGGPKNARDILYLQGVDMALVNTDALESLKERSSTRRSKSASPTSRNSTTKKFTSLLMEGWARSPI